MTTIFAFINSRSGHNWIETLAIHPDGRILAGHVSSSLAFAKHDIGVTSDWKHNKYREACPEGFAVEWVEEPAKHPGVTAAHAAALARGEIGR